MGSTTIIAPSWLDFRACVTIREFATVKRLGFRWTFLLLINWKRYISMNVRFFLVEASFLITFCARTQSSRRQSLWVLDGNICCKMTYCFSFRWQSIVYTIKLHPRTLLFFILFSKRCAVIFFFFLYKKAREARLITSFLYKEAREGLHTALTKGASFRSFLYRGQPAGGTAFAKGSRTKVMYVFKRVWLWKKKKKGSTLRLRFERQSERHIYAIFTLAFELQPQSGSARFHYRMPVKLHRNSKQPCSQPLRDCGWMNNALVQKALI